MDVGSFEVREVALDTLSGWSGNPRTITPRAMEALDSSIARWGLVQPIVWNERSGRVVGGHQRLEVLRRRSVPSTSVVVVSLDDTEEKALNVALNSGSISGQFTDEVDTILAELQSSFDGFDDLLLGDLQSAPPHVDVDFEPPPPPPKRTAATDLDDGDVVSSSVVVSLSFAPEDVVLFNAALVQCRELYGLAWGEEPSDATMLLRAIRLHVETLRQEVSAP